MRNLYSKRASGEDDKEIQQILQVTERPEIISFAGGLPAPELFPKEEMKKVFEFVFDEYSTQALQYGPTEGYSPLRKVIAERMNAIGINTPFQNIIVISGSQQGLDLLGKIFIDEGDKIVCESPTYLAAVSSFGTYSPQFIEVPMDEDGMIMEELENTLKQHPDVKFIYTVPEFQNPTGRTMSLTRRKKMVELANRYQVYIVEDNPYGELRFEGEKLSPVKHFDTEDRVIYMSTFSKILAPGLRVGWIVANPEIIQKLILFKQNTDLHTNTISQIAIANYFKMYDIEKHIDKIRKVYRERRNLMLAMIKSEFPEGVKTTHPEGGLFLWVELPQGLNAKEILIKCIENNVAFVPGGPFYPNGGNTNTFRLNYSNASEEKIVEGIKRIAKVLREEVVTVK